MINEAFKNHLGLTARSNGDAIGIKLVELLDHDIRNRVIQTNADDDTTINWTWSTNRTRSETAATKATLDLANAVTGINWESLPADTIRLFAANLVVLAQHQSSYST